MLPYPPPYAQTKTGENQVLRSLGAIVALLGALFSLLGIIFHQGGFELIFALLIAILSLRAFVLWLGATQSSQKREPFTPPQTRNSQPLHGPYPPQQGYFVPQQPQSSFFPTGTNQMTVPFTPAAPGAPFAPVNAQGFPSVRPSAPLPPSVRPQAQGGFFSGQAQGMPPGSYMPPTQTFAPGQLMPQPMPPAPMQQPMQAPANATRAYAPSPYAPGQPPQPAPAAPPTAFPQPGQPVDSRQWGQGQQPLPEQGW